MKKTTILALSALALFNTAASAQNGEQKEGFIAKPITLGKTVNGWTEVSNGLLMRIWKDVPGATPQVGDFITLHTRARVGDSILFSSRAVNNNEPFELQVRPPQQPKYDLMEAFQLLSPGDSATFRMPLDSILAMGAPELPWMKKGAGMLFDQDIVMVKSVKQADAFKEKAAKGIKQMKDDSVAINKYFKDKKITGYKRHPSGLYYKIHQVGSGDTAKPGQKVTVNYTGKTIAGKVFDSNTDTAFHHVEPFSFLIGQGQEIPGWDIGVSLLKKGSKATLYIPSPLAYGEGSPSAEIPKNGILIFDVEVKNIEDAPKAEQHSKDDGHNH